MPLTKKPPRTTKIEFLYGMVVGTFAASHTYDADLQAARIEAEIIEAEGENIARGVIEIFSLCVVYTQEMEFDWHEEAPEGWRAFEKLWEMIISGKSIIDCWKFFTVNVDLTVMLLNKTRRNTASLDKLWSHLHSEDPQTAAKEFIEQGQEMIEASIQAGQREEIGWSAARRKAVQVWEPPIEWRLEEELTPEQRANPLSNAPGK
jgi:hypothetical protein